MYWKTSVTTDLGTLIVQDFNNLDKKEVLYTSQKAQIDAVIFYPIEHTVLAVTEIYHKRDIHVINSTILEDINYLNSIGTITYIDMSLGKKN